MRARTHVLSRFAFGALVAAGLASGAGGAEPVGGTAPGGTAPGGAATATAGVLDTQRARNDYLIHCMGCHRESGLGFEPAVPSLRGPMARFARSAEGRAYLMRIPGVTQSSLSPERVAAVLNWSLHEFNPPKDVAGIRPFTADEIAAARKQPLLEVVETRARLAARAY